MKARRRPMALAVVYTLLGGINPTFAAGTGNTFAEMLRGMATGLALLGGAGGPSASPYLYPGTPFYPSTPGMRWPGPATMPGWGAPPWTAYPAYPPRTHDPKPDSPRLLERLQGSWKTDGGGLLLVRRDMARLYVARDRYQDFYIRVDQRHLWMWPVDSQVSQRYAHHIAPDRVVLRDEFGSSLTLIRYRPSPPEK